MFYKKKLTLILAASLCCVPVVGNDRKVSESDVPFEYHRLGIVKKCVKAYGIFFVAVGAASFLCLPVSNQVSRLRVNTKFSFSENILYYLCAGFVFSGLGSGLLHITSKWEGKLSREEQRRMEEARLGDMQRQVGDMQRQVGDMQVKIRSKEKFIATLRKLAEDEEAKKASQGEKLSGVQ